MAETKIDELVREAAEIRGKASYTSILLLAIVSVASLLMSGFSLLHTYTMGK